MRVTERALKRTAAYREHTGEDENYEIFYVIFKGDLSRPDDIIAQAIYQDEALIFHPFSDNEVTPMSSCDIDIDDDFEYLEYGYKIAEMSLACHFYIWHSISETNGDYIECLQGFQLYLGYCKKNGITVEKLRNEEDYTGMDIMEFYKKP